jgi:hypothetical protein
MSALTPEAVAGAKFFDAAFEQMIESFDWDGCDMQAAAKKAGLIYEREYDPVTDEGMDAEEGDTVFVLTDVGKGLLSLLQADPQP